MPARNSSKHKQTNSFSKKEQDLSNMSVNDALSALKKKFGK
jgi:hypothetical protein